MGHWKLLEYYFLNIVDETWDTGSCWSTTFFNIVDRKETWDTGSCWSTTFFNIVDMKETWDTGSCWSTTFFNIVEAAGVLLSLILWI